MTLLALADKCRVGSPSLLLCSRLSNFYRLNSFQDAPSDACQSLRSRGTLVLALAHHPPRPQAISTIPSFRLTYACGWTQWIRSSTIALPITESLHSGQNHALMFCITLVHCHCLALSAHAHVSCIHTCNRNQSSCVNIPKLQ